MKFSQLSKLVAVVVVTTTILTVGRERIERTVQIRVIEDRSKSI